MEFNIAVIAGSPNDFNMIVPLLENLDEYDIEIENFKTPDAFQDKNGFGKDTDLLILIVDSPHTTKEFSQAIYDFYVGNMNRFSCPVLLITSDGEIESKLNLEKRKADFAECVFNVDSCFLGEVVKRILE